VKIAITYLSYRWILIVLFTASSSAGVHSNFSANQQQQRASTSYEPGTGAAFMAQSGWNNRDA
jgi:hypothetical protein